MTQLSPHFTLAELISSQTAVRRGIANQPTIGEIENLKRLAATLEQVRELLGHPLHISSGFRCLKLNQAIGSGSTSAHVKGLAADFTCPGYGNPRLVAKRIADSGIEFDQLIYEGTWVHLGLRDGKQRRDILTAQFKDAGVSYLRGIL